MLSGGRHWVEWDSTCSYSREVITGKDFDINFDGVPDAVGYRSSQNCSVSKEPTLWIGRKEAEPIKAISYDFYEPPTTGATSKVFRIGDLEIQVRETKGSHPYHVGDLVTVPDAKHQGTRRNGQIQGFLFEVDFQTFQRRRVAADVRIGPGKDDVITVDLNQLRFRDRPY